MSLQTDYKNSMWEKENARLEAIERQEELDDLEEKEAKEMISEITDSFLSSQRIFCAGLKAGQKINHRG